MKFPAKFVAALMVIALWVMPLSAAMLCASGMQATTHCGQCCHGMAAMAEPGMNATTTTTMGKTDPAEVFSPCCCKFAPGQRAAQTLAREAQRPLTLIALQPNASTVAAAIPSAPSQDIRPVPDRLTSSRLQSALCTFLI